MDPTRTGLVWSDWQVDCCGPGGYVDTMGYDLKLTRSGLEPTAVVLAAARSAGMMVVHTREGHLPDLSDCPPNKLWRSKRIGAGLGDAGPCGRILVKGDPGWGIVPVVAPVAGGPGEGPSGRSGPGHPASARSPRPITPGALPAGRPELPDVAAPCGWRRADIAPARRFTGWRLRRPPSKGGLGYRFLATTLG